MFKLDIVIDQIVFKKPSIQIGLEIEKKQLSL